MTIQPHLEAIHHALHNIPLEDIMSSPAITINVQEDFSVAEETFVNKRIRQLMIVDGRGKIVGCLSHKDLYRHIAPRRSPEGSIQYREGIIVDKDGYYEKESLNKFILNNVMIKNPITLKKDNSFGEAIHQMVLHNISCIPVVDDDHKPIGIVTRYDVLRLANSIYTQK